jgi:hypothetical protein
MLSMVFDVIVGLIVEGMFSEDRRGKLFFGFLAVVGLIVLGIVLWKP